MMMMTMMTMMMMMMMMRSPLMLVMMINTLCFQLDFELIEIFQLDLFVSIYATEVLVLVAKKMWHLPL